MSLFCKACGVSETFVVLAKMEAEAMVDENGEFCDWLTLDGAIESPAFEDAHRCHECNSTNIVNIPSHIIEYYVNDEWNAFEEVEVSDFYEDDNNGFKFGVHFGTYTMNRESIDISCQWFEEEQERKDFMDKLREEKFVHADEVNSLKEGE